MQKIIVKLTKREFESLNHMYPNTGKSAEQIIKYYFKHKYTECKFIHTNDGSDLTIRYKNSQESIEIKGTIAKTISWHKLKVSSQSSYDMLCNGLPVYRVTGVFNREPIIYILYYTQDFTLFPEKRWAVKAIQ